MRDVLRRAVKQVIVVGAVIFVCIRPTMDLKAIPQRGSCTSALDQGKVLLGQRQFSQAEDVLVGAAGTCPKVAEIFETLGLAYDFDGRPAEAQAAYRRAISIDPNKAEFHNNLAGSLLRSEKQDAAISEFRKALGIDPANRTANL